MKAKHYTLFWLLFSIAAGLYIYSFNSEIYTYTPPFGETSLSLPVAIWSLVPLFFFFVLSLCLILLGKAQSLWEEYHSKKDRELLLRQILAQASEKEFKGELKTHTFKSISKILRRFKLIAQPHTPLSDDEEIDSLIEASSKITQGEVVDLKRFHLPYTASLNLQNQLNRLKIDPKSALEILKKTEAPDSLKKVALLSLFESGEEKEIRKYQNLIPLDKELAKALLGAYEAKRLKLGFDEIASLGEKAVFEARDYLGLAKELKGSLEPDSWLKLFEVLAEKHEAAEEAYLYVLLELEMIEVAKERLSAHSKEDFPKIRAFLELRKSGFSYPAEIFFF